MRAILVDPYTRTIKEVDYSGDGSHICELVQCGLFTTHSIGANITCWLDDSGNWTQRAWFKFDHPNATPVLYCGRMLVTSDGPSGESVDLDPMVTTANLAASIKWLGMAAALAFAEEIDERTKQIARENPHVIFTDDGLADRIGAVVDVLEHETDQIIEAYHDAVGDMDGVNLTEWVLDTFPRVTNADEARFLLRTAGIPDKDFITTGESA